MGNEEKKAEKTKVKLKGALKTIVRSLAFI
jgi:hypothetical protein